jgi:hypothetical protein
MRPNRKEKETCLLVQIPVVDKPQDLLSIGLLLDYLQKDKEYLNILQN